MDHIENDLAVVDLDLEVGQLTAVAVAAPDPEVAKGSHSDTRLPSRVQLGHFFRGEVLLQLALVEQVE